MTTSTSTTTTTTTNAKQPSSPWPAIKAPPSAKVYYYQEEDGSPTANPQKIQSVESSMNYCADWVTKPYTRRDLQGNDDELIGVEWYSATKAIQNARLSQKTLHQNGFELVTRPVQHKIDFRNSKQVIEEYYPQCQKLLQEHTGASKVYCFDHNVRVSGGPSTQEDGDTSDTTSLQQPLGMVHNDYTHVSAPRRLEQLGQPPKANDSMKQVLGDQPLLDPTVVQDVLEGKRRFVFCNVWRSIDTDQPIQQYPLAFVDATTQSLEDMVTFQIHYADRIGENYFSKHRDHHEWNYFPQMSHDEAILLKQWDSHGTLALKKTEDNAKDIVSTFSLHSAIQDPTSPKLAPPRQSIEVRCVLIWDKEEEP